MPKSKPHKKGRGHKVDLDGRLLTDGATNGFSKGWYFDSIIFDHPYFTLKIQVQKLSLNLKEHICCLDIVDKHNKYQQQILYFNDDVIYWNRSNPTINLSDHVV